MNRRGFLSRLVAAIGLAPMLGLLPSGNVSDDMLTVTCRTTGAFSNNMRVEFLPGSIWINGGVAYFVATSSNGQTVWVTTESHHINTTI